MHQSVEHDPITPETSIWEFYLDAPSMQWAADCWPASTFLKALFSKSTENIKITNGAGLDKGRNIHFEVTGRAYQDVQVTFSYSLDPKELDHAQKEGIRATAKVLYENERLRGYPTYRKVCKALGVPVK